MNKPEIGWHWISLEDIEPDYIPCYFTGNCFLPAGLGDESSMGIRLDEVKIISEQIFPPQ